MALGGNALTASHPRLGAEVADSLDFDVRPGIRSGTRQYASACHRQDLTCRRKRAQDGFKSAAKRTQFIADSPATRKTSPAWNRRSFWTAAVLCRFFLIGYRMQRRLRAGKRRSTKHGRRKSGLPLLFLAATVSPWIRQLESDEEVNNHRCTQINTDFGLRVSAREIMMPTHPHTRTRGYFTGRAHLWGERMVSCKRLPSVSIGVHPWLNCVF